MNVKCKNCQKEFDYLMNYCPHCGTKKESDYSFKKDQKPAQKLSDIPIGLQFGLALIFFAFSIFVFVMPFVNHNAKTRTPAQQSAVYNTNSDFKATAQQVVREHLKAPGSAKFISTDIITRKSDGGTLAKVTVDAQNSFGVALRTTYWVVFAQRTTSNQYSYKRGIAVLDAAEYSQAEVERLYNW